MTNYTITTDAEVSIHINIPVPSSGPPPLGELFTAVVDEEDVFMCRLRHTNGDIIIEQMLRSRSSQEALEEFMVSIKIRTTGPYHGTIYGDLDLSVRKL